MKWTNEISSGEHAGRESLLPRDQFPATAAETYLNSAGIGLMSLAVQEKVFAFSRRLATEGTRVFFDNEQTIATGAKIGAAKLLNAPPSSIAIGTSAAEFFNQAAWWLRPKKGQNVVTIDIDHPSVTYPWLRVAEETGAEVRFLRVENDPLSLTTEAVAALIDDNTVAVSVSHALWTTGHLLDLKMLSERAHAHGAYLFVDATHTVGAIPVDAPATGADFLVTVAFKWLRGFSGSSICYVNPEIIDRIHPILVGNKSSGKVRDTKPAGYDATNVVFPDGAEKLEYASSSHVSRYALSVALEEANAIDMVKTAEHLRALGTRLGTGLAQLDAQLLTPFNHKQRAGIVTARFPDHDGRALSEALERERVMTLPRVGGVRFSPHIFNNDDDIDRALDAIRRLLGR